MLNIEERLLKAESKVAQELEETKLKAIAFQREMDIARQEPTYQLLRKKVDDASLVELVLQWLRWFGIKPKIADILDQERRIARIELRFVDEDRRFYIPWINICKIHFHLSGKVEIWKLSNRGGSDKEPRREYDSFDSFLDGICLEIMRRKHPELG